jgi:poly(hydroxyalkanoate) depolymerase family esterase
MPRRSVFSVTSSALSRAYQSSLRALTKATLRNSKRIAGQVTRAAAKQLKPPPGPGDWIAGMAFGPAGARRFHLFRPPTPPPASGVRAESPTSRRMPLLVMLHGCGQTGRDFAASTRMNRLAVREGFMVLYPEQDRLANAQGCWNWYDARSGKAAAEAATLMAAIDQVSQLYLVDRERVAVAGLSAGAGMAALLGSRYPTRFKAVAMHSGVGPGAAQSAASALGAMRGRRAPAMPAASVAALAAAAMEGGSVLPPLMVVHGTIDAVVSERNAGAAAEVWAQAIGAERTVPRYVQRGKRRPMRVTDFQRDGRTLVTLCEVAGLGHAWSGGAAQLAFGDAEGPDATKLIWAFAEKQFDTGRG